MSTADRGHGVLVEGILARDRRAISRAITIVENDGPDGDALYRRICSLARSAPKVGFTGPPGVGKSTLVGAYIGWLRSQGKTVAVAAVDPSSPLSGGAILGDRIRMVEQEGDEGVFIRSIASRGHGGGISATLHRIADVMSAAAYDVVIMETVGAGQADAQIVDIADVNVVVNVPGLGDDVQAIKSGILEIADVLVLNKADLPAAQEARAQLEGMLRLRAGHAQNVAIVSTVATNKTGISDLAAAIETCAVAAATPEERAKRARARARKLLAESVAQAVRDYISRDRSEQVARLCDEIAAGRIDSASAATAVLDLMIVRNM